MRALELEEDHALAGPDLLLRDISEAAAVNAAGPEIAAQAMKVDGDEGRGPSRSEKGTSSRERGAGAAAHLSAGQDTQPVHL